MLDQWVSFQGFIGGNLLVTGGIIADHIAADAIDASKITANGVTANEISFVRAAGSDVRADTLQVQAANVLGRLTATQINATNLHVAAANITGRLTATQINATNLEVASANIIGRLTASQIDASGITVNALNITGTIRSSQLDEKVRAPVTLYQKSTTGIGTYPANHGTSNLTDSQAWARGALTTFTNSTYDSDELTTHFRHFLLEGYFRAWRVHGTIGVGNFDKFISQLVPVERLYSSVGARTTQSVGLEIGWRIVMDSDSATHPPVILWITPVANTRPRIQMDLQSITAGGGQGWARFDLHRIAGVWKE